MTKSDYEIGDMYKACIAYEDDPNQSKMRPIVIVDINDGDFIYVKFTSQFPKNTYSKYEKLKKAFLK